MKQIKQDVAMNMFGVGLAYLLFWVAMHKLRPEDAWINMLFRPSFLIVAPLAVAFIPLLAAKPEQSTTRADIEDGSGGYLRRKTRWFNPNMARRMALVWLISLATFAAPHTLQAATWDPVFHRPAFLIVAPLLMACLSLVIPDRNLPHEAAAGTQATGGYPSRPVAWAYLLLGIALLIFFLMLLIVANNSSTSPNDGSNSELNIALLLLFMLPLALIWLSLKRLRKRK